MNKQIRRCNRCNCALHPDYIVWMELSMTDGKYYLPDEFPEGHESQGAFPFGESCAKNANSNQLYGEQ